MALGVTDLKKGTVFSFEGTPYIVTEYSQKVMGRGGSIVNVKTKSLLDGKVIDNYEYATARRTLDWAAACAAKDSYKARALSRAQADEKRYD